MEPLSKISVIIPTYNRHTLVPLAIESVLSQTRAPAEIIVVDNGSTPETASTLARYGDRIRVLRLDPNAGLSGARNAGIKATSTEWVTFLDDDDEYCADRIEIQEASIRSFPQSDVHVTNTCIVTPGAPEVDLFKARGMNCLELMPESAPLSWVLKGCFFAQSMVVRRLVVEEVGMFRDTLFEDMDLYVRLVSRTPWIIDSRASFRLIRRPNSTVLSHDWRARPIKRNQALVDIHRCALELPGLTAEEIRLTRDRLGSHLFELGCSLHANNETKQARSCFRESTRLARRLRSKGKAAVAVLFPSTAMNLVDRLSRNEAPALR